MQKKLMVLLLVITISFLLLSTRVARAQEQNSSEVLWSIVNKLDIAAASLRRGDTSSASTYISSAYEEYAEKLSTSVAAADNSLDDQIKQSFQAVAQNPIENNIFSLRSDVSRAAALIGVYLSPLFAYSIFIILAIGILAAFSVTFVSKHMVNWELVKQNKAKISEYYKEFREAQKKRDMKSLHKIQQRQNEIMQMQKVNSMQNLKPTIIYFVPLLLLWVSLGIVFRGWVVAWMPFVRIDLPFIGPLVTFGVGWWYFITYLGFSQIFRKIMIGD